MVRSRLLAGAMSLVLLSGCSLDLGGAVNDTLGLGSTAPPTRNAFVVGDEPYAVRAGASILRSGGNAVDAATAIYFTLAVTYPVAASLGGGGICIVHDPASGQNAEYDFLARDSAGGGAYAVPGNVRGFALMQADYGALPWQRVIAPAESFARTGFPISHALAARLTAGEDLVRLDAGLAAEFMDETGHVKQAGRVVANPELAGTLAQIRINGPEAFYNGAIAQQILGYSAAQGGSITAGELAAYPALRVGPGALQLQNQNVLLPHATTGAGAFAAAMLQNLVQAQLAGGDLQAAVSAAAKNTLAGFGIANLPNDLGATGFAALDGNGQAVACAVTMNGPFGSGHDVTGTGITLANAPSSGQAGLASAFLTPVIAAGDSGVSLVGAGAGGPDGTASMAFAISRIARGEAVPSAGDLHTVGTGPYDTVNAIICQTGACVASSDRGANGLGLAVPVR